MSSPVIPARRLSQGLNAAILLALLVLGGILVKRFYFARDNQPNYKLAPQARLSIAGINWGSTERTVLIALRKDCKYCSESASFYRRLVSQLQSQTNARVIALFPEKETGGEAYLSELGIPIADVRYVSLGSLGINISPTLVLLDRNGVVADLWIGKLPPRVESVVMKRLDLKDTRPLTDWLVDETTIRSRLAHHESVVLLDVRDRAPFAADHKDGARNIPLDELRVRAVNELSTADDIVLNGSEYQTDLAYTILDAQGFLKITILAPGPIR